MQAQMPIFIQQPQQPQQDQQQQPQYQPQQQGCCSDQQAQQQPQQYQPQQQQISTKGKNKATTPSPPEEDPQIFTKMFAMQLNNDGSMAVQPVPGANF